MMHWRTYASRQTHSIHRRPWPYASELDSAIFCRSDATRWGAGFMRDILSRRVGGRMLL